ncbi:NTP transferase domain-containing protein, partial [Candidatus Peregrinibacteria bacterium]|nr:NTP transferase domain-containing protein [Candidatus Peregrinibacteria bacterium]
AGRSQRFWPLTEKTLFPVCGRTLLEHQIDRLRSAGINDITLVGGAHNLEEARSVAGSIPAIEQKDLTLGMRGAVLSILEKHGTTEPLMLVSGNDVIDPSGYRLLLQSGGDGALLGKRVTTYFPGGYLKTKGERITAIIEKPGAGNEPSDLVTIVAHVHRNPKQLLSALTAINGPADGAYEQALEALFPALDYRAITYESVWQAVKYPWHLLPLTELLLGEITAPNIHPTAIIHPTAVIEGNVVLDEGAKVYPHATVRGPAYIGKRSIVANNALVRNSSIGDDCVVGFSTEVKGSVLKSHVWTHMNYIGDSVIGRNVSIGGGTLTANFRLDEAHVRSAVNGEQVETHLPKFGCVIGDDCRIGIHVSINPGIKIGRGCLVGSSALIAEDLMDNRFVVVKNGTQEVRENTRPVPQTEERREIRKKL